MRLINKLFAQLFVGLLTGSSVVACGGVEDGAEADATEQAALAEPANLWPRDRKQVSVNVLDLSNPQAGLAISGSFDGTNWSLSAYDTSSGDLAVAGNRAEWRVGQPEPRIRFAGKDMNSGIRSIGGYVLFELQCSGSSPHTKMPGAMSLFPASCSTPVNCSAWTVENTGAATIPMLEYYNLLLSENPGCNPTLFRAFPRVTVTNSKGLVTKANDKVVINYFQ